MICAITPNTFKTKQQYVKFCNESAPTKQSDKIAKDTQSDKNASQ